MFRPLLTCPAYHHIGDSVPSAAAQLGVWTKTDAFEAHLDHYEANYDIVDLETLLRQPWPRRPLLLAFDDSYRSLATTVAPILKRRRLPGIVFLNPDMIEHPAVQVDHVLSELDSRVGTAPLLAEIGPAATVAGSVQAYLNGPAVELTRAACIALQKRLLAAFGLDEAELHAELELYLRPKDILALTDAGLEIANHTASHTRCRMLSVEDMAIELAGAKLRLAALSGRPVRAFSVPYGSRHDATAEVLATLAASGHEAVFLADGRLSAKGASGTNLWDRIPMDGVSTDALPLHLGVRPRLRGIKDLARGWTRSMTITPVAQSAVAAATILRA
jgi:peptidoglycan/xylan/chitin deacetylase (PgdA/CDA1 family)